MSHGALRTDIVTLEPAHLDLDIALSARTLTTEPTAPQVNGKTQPPLALKVAVDSYQRQLIRDTLEACEQNWAEAARHLDLDPSNLHKLAKRLGLK